MLFDLSRENNRNSYSFLVGAIVIGSFFTLGLLRIAKNKKRKIELDQKVVLITGSSRGLGFVLGKQLAAQGSTVILCARNPHELDRAAFEILQLGGKVSTFVCDVSSQTQVNEMVDKILKEYDQIDILINNASIIQVGPMELMTIRDFDVAMAINYWGTVYSTLAVLPSMIQRKCGRIANITSIGGVIAVPHLLPYTAAKFATRGFSEGLATELSQYGITVTTVIPGLMRTGSFINALFKGNKPEYLWFSLSDSLPILSINAERAASKIIKAIQYGDLRITLGLSAKIGSLLNSIFPTLVKNSLAVINRLLPHPIKPIEQLRPGKTFSLGILSSSLLTLGNRAARKFNEY